MDKTVGSAAQAVADVLDGASVAVGGFGTAGVPWGLISALQQNGAQHLTVVTNNCGVNGAGLALLLEAGRIDRVIASYIGSNLTFARSYLQGEVEVELTPQGTLAERLRAGGAGIAAFYTATGVGTLVAEGGQPQLYSADGQVVRVSRAKEVRRFGHGPDEREYVLEEAIRTDFAFVRAARADRHGNAVFHASARNFNPDVAMAGRTTIVEADQVVEAGMLDPDSIHLPGIYVQRVVEAQRGVS